MTFSNRWSSGYDLFMAVVCLETRKKLTRVNQTELPPSTLHAWVDLWIGSIWRQIAYLQRRC